MYEFQPGEKAHEAINNKLAIIIGSADLIKIDEGDSKINANRILEAARDIEWIVKNTDIVKIIPKENK